MKAFSFLFIVFMFVLLVGCGPTNTVSIPAQSSESVPENEDRERPPTATARPSSTPLPSKTPDLTRTAVIQDRSTEQAAEQTLIAQFPRVCSDVYSPPEFSPNGLWMEEFCYSENDDGPILTLSNKETRVLWKLFFRDFTPRIEIFPDGGLAVVHWSNDGKYAYFNSFVSGSGGECFVDGDIKEYGKGLFRLDLQTGNTSTVLPIRDDFVGYGFSFSPTGRRVVYDYNRKLSILDLTSGKVLDVPGKQFSGAAGYLWSPDGLQFVYSTVLYEEFSHPIAYSLRLVNAQSGSEQILIESQENCFAARTWKKDDILTIEKYDKNYDRSLIEYNLKSNKVISEATATPHP